MPAQSNFISRIICTVLLTLLFTACGDSQFAPPGTTLTINANPSQVPVNGTATITATALVDGEPVADGTAIRFFVTEGSGNILPASAPTENGIATATFQASPVEGEVSISAMSGPELVSTEIDVVELEGKQLTLTADPVELPEEGGTSIITALVTDGSNRPLAGERLVFSTDEGSLESLGRTVTTNQEGIATDVLTTDATAEVTVEFVDESADPETITVAVGSIAINCDFEFTPENPTVGTSVQFTDTSEDPRERLRSSFWDFGDGGTALGFSVQHTYLTDGRFTIVHSVVDVDGNTFTCASQQITVTGSET